MVWLKMPSAPLFEPTVISGLFKVGLDHRPDSRGWFEEIWQSQKWASSPLSWFRPLQQNSSSNLVAGSTRGLHAEPWNKLVTVVSGRAFCVWVDLREGESFGKRHWQTLSPGEAFFVPEGVANGYQSLEPNTVYTYLVDGHWSANASYPAVNPFDLQLEIPWPIAQKSAEVSEKDRQSPSFNSSIAIPCPQTIVFGSSGQVGSELRRAIPQSRVGNRSEIATFSGDGKRYSAIINAAAYTAVDSAENPSAWSQVLESNQVLVDELASLAIDLNTTLVHYSSDYVFDGIKADPWREHDLPNPLSRYGQSKLLGDYVAKSLQRHYLIRTSWVYGAGRNFVRTMYERAIQGLTSDVVGDQYGRPTWARDLALFTKFLVDTRAPFGTYNFTGSGEPVSWHDIAVYVYQFLGKDPGLVSKITSETFASENPHFAPRPKNSVLDLKKTGDSGFNPPEWPDSLAQYLASLSQSATP